MFNVKKSHFALHGIEYLEYVLSRDNIKPQPEKVTVILALREPQNVKEVCRFLGMAQYYSGMYRCRSHTLAPLADLLGEAGEMKVTLHPY